MKHFLFYKVIFSRKGWKIIEGFELPAGGRGFGKLSFTVENKNWVDGAGV